MASSSSAKSLDEHQDIEAELRDYLELEDWKQAECLGALSKERARDCLELLNRVVELKKALGDHPDRTALNVIEAAAFAHLRNIARSCLWNARLERR